MNLVRERLITHPQIEIAFSLIRQQKYLDAYDRFQASLLNNPQLFPDILTILYRELSKDTTNLKLKLIIAELYLQKKKYDNAFEELEEMMQIDPNNTQAYFLLSKYFKRFSQQKKIQHYFEEAFQNNLNDSAIIETLANIYMTQKDIKKGIPFYEKLCNKTNNIQHIKGLSFFYRLDNNFDKAADTFETVLKVSPSDIPNLMIDCETLLKKCPDNKKIHELLIKLYTKACEPEKAVTLLQDMILFNLINQSQLLEEYKQLLDLFPNHEIIMMGHAESLIKNEHITEAIDQLRIIFEKYKRTDLKIINLLQDSLIKFPKNIPTLMLILDIQMAKKQFEKAIKTILNLIDGPQQYLKKLETHLTLIKLASPKNANQCQLALSRILAKTGYLEEALSELEKSYDTEEDLNSRIIAIELCFNNNKVFEAKEKLKETLKKYPYKLEVHRIAKRIFRKTLNKHKEELKNSKRENHIRSLEKGIINLCDESIEKALAEFQKIEDSNEEFSQAQLLIGRCFMELSRYDLAINRLEPYLNLLKANKSELKNKIRYLLSINHACMGNYDDALSFLDEILSFDISFPHIKEQIESLKKRGRPITNGHMVTAVIMPSCKPILLVAPPSHPTLNLKINSPSFATSHHETGIQSLFKNDLEMAKQSFNLAIALDPTFHESHINLATIACIQKNFEKAWKYIKIVEETHPKLNVLHLTKGLYYFNQSNFKVALEHYKKALDVFPEDTLAMLAIGDCFYHQEDIETAYRYWENALKKGPYFYIIHRRWCYLSPAPTQTFDWTEDLNLSFNPIRREKQSQLNLSLPNSGPLFNE